MKVPRFVSGLAKAIVLAALAMTALAAGCSVRSGSLARSPLSPVATPPRPRASIVPTEQASPPAPSMELVVLHTNDTWGYVLPCG